MRAFRASGPATSTPDCGLAAVLRTAAWTVQAQRPRRGRATPGAGAARAHVARVGSFCE